MNIEIADLAMNFLGTPYIYGGNDIAVGVDCSAFANEMLRSVGQLDKKDYSAQMLHDELNDRLFVSNSTKKNAVLFFGSSIDNITHVAISLGDGMMIEAGGEGRVNTDKGYVRVRPIDSRLDLISGILLEE